MSKEMLVIVLGVWIIVVRTLLGVPGSWQTALFILSGIALMVVGFLLRGEAISRSSAPRVGNPRSYSFVESAPEVVSTNEHKEGITSLN
jgi:uncharacterized protein involved in copper resistance